MSDKPIKLLALDEKTVTTQLEKSGYREKGIQLIQVSSPIEVQDFLKSKEADLLVINLDSHGEVAPSLCESLRKDDTYFELPIIVTSVQRSQGQKASSLKAGADLFIEQPIPRTHYIEKIKQLLSKTTRNSHRVEDESLGTAEITIEKGEAKKLNILDLSISGILLACPIEMTEGTPCLLEFSLPGYKKPLKVEGKIVRNLKENPRTKTPAGVGIRFELFSGDGTKRLNRFLDTFTAKKNEELIYYL